ncbi:MAG: OprO/OprP family phosphate-selective porin [Bacteroidetes bacterium]|jgi:hypothetical protein|nr:OprO/OprP family phosphate-selective porin [Bacteroidota bacterium]
MKNIYFLLLGVLLLSFQNIEAQEAQPIAKIKFGKGLAIMAPDSSLYIKATFRFQSLFDAKRNLEDGADWNSNFLVRRARFKFNGWAINPNFGYKVELALSNRDLSTSSDFDQTSGAPKIILDAVVKWKFHKNFTLWAGQTKLPGNRQRVVSSQAMQLVDRSVVNSIFNIDRDIGVHLRGKFKSGKVVVKPIVALSMGEGRNVTSQNIGGLNYTGRLEVLPFGEFASKGDYFEADLKREATPKLAIGASYNLNRGASRQKHSGKFLIDTEGDYLENDLQTTFVDAMFKYRGLSILAEYADKRCVLDNGVSHEEVKNEMIDANGRTYYTGKGFSIQSGYLFKNNWEIASRFTTVTPDWDMSFTGLNEYTLGISKYVVGHNLKVQSDITLTDKEGTDVNSLRYRFQFEFAF